MCALPSSNDGCPVVLSPDIPSTSWWSFCGEWRWSGDEVLQKGRLDHNTYWQECHKLARRAQFFCVWEGQEGACLQVPVSCMQRLTTFPTCQSTKICQRHQGNRIPFPASHVSAVWRMRVNAPERVTPLALKTWNQDAISTSNDAKSNLQGSIWQIPVSSTHHKNQLCHYIFLCYSKVSILWVGLGLTEISQS